MSTATAVDFVKAVRTRLLTFNGGAIATALGTADGAGSDGKLYLDQVPDPMPFPFGVLSVLDWRAEGDDGAYARRFEVELSLFHRPRSSAAALKAIADQCERALRSWTDFSSGPMVVTPGMLRATVRYEAPADRELVQERLVIPGYVHPTYLTQDTA